jgi:hypothetical protein
MPNPSYTPEDIDRLARKRAGAKMGWYAHALVFVCVNATLFLISEQAFGQRHWSIKPVLGWGLGLALHWVAVFMLGSGSSLREHLVAKERAKLLAERDGV